MAVEEKDAIWGLLWIPHPDLLEPSIVTHSPTSSSDEVDEDDEDEDVNKDEDAQVRAQIQQVINQIDATTHLTASQDKQLDTYELANLALSIQELANMYDMLGLAFHHFVTHSSDF